MSIVEIETVVGEEDTPCIARATHYEPEVPAWTRGHPDGWEEGEPAIVDFDLLDLDGRENHELWELATDRDLSRIAARLIEEVESIRRYGDH